MTNCLPLSGTTSEAKNWSVEEGRRTHAASEAKINSPVRRTSLRLALNDRLIL